MAERSEGLVSRHEVIVQSEGDAGLHTPGILAKWPWIGLIMLMIGGIAFSTLSYNVFTNGPLLRWDVPLSRALPAYGLQHAALFRPLTTAGFWIGGYLLTASAALLDLYFLIKHYWEELFMLLAGMVGEFGLFGIVNTLVDRPRPPTQIWIPLKIPSFPSGHEMATVVFFGFLAYILVPKARSGFVKALIVIVTILIILFVGFTRVFTAGHYLTDVLAGFALGLAWAGIAYTFVELYFRDKRRRDDKKR